MYNLFASQSCRSFYWLGMSFPRLSVFLTERRGPWKQQENCLDNSSNAKWYSNEKEGKKTDNERKTRKQWKKNVYCNNSWENSSMEKKINSSFASSFSTTTLFLLFFHSNPSLLAAIQPEQIGHEWKWFVYSKNSLHFLSFVKEHWRIFCWRHHHEYLTSGW